MQTLKVLREVTNLPFNVQAILEENLRLIERDDGSLWVDNDKPWDANMVYEIMLHTGRFVVADEDYGFVAGPYSSLDKAERARNGAKITLTTEFATTDEDEPAAPLRGRRGVE